MKKVIWKLANVMCGTLFMAMAVNFVYEPMSMVTGGISGLAIAIKKMVSGYIPGGIPVWLTNISLNIPIFIWAYFKKGKGFWAILFLQMFVFLFSY